MDFTSGPIPETGTYVNFFRRRQTYLLILLVNYLLYFKSLAFSFTWFDDDVLITMRHGFLRDIGSAARVFSEVYHSTDGAYYRPLLNLSFILDAQLGGVSPFNFHLTNILLHIAASFLVYRVFVECGVRERFAGFFALLFTAHPALVQAVAWIPGRNDSLLAVFMLSSFLCLVRFLDSRRFVYAALHTFFFALAMLTKESALAGPVVFLAYLYALRAKPRPGAGWLAAAWAGVALGWFLLKHVIARGVQETSLAGMLVNLYHGLPALVQYAGKIVFPVNLSVLPTLASTTFVTGAAALALITAAVLVSKHRDMRYVLFGAAWFTLFALPPLVNSQKFVLEHRMYLPVIGLFFCAYGIAGGWALTGRYRAAARAAGFLLLAWFAVTNYVYSDTFGSRIVLWRAAARSTPRSSLVHNNLAAAYIDYGLPWPAEAQVRKALELDGNNASAHNNMAFLLLRKGMLGEAEAELRRAVELDKNDFHIYANYADLCFVTGRMQETEEYLNKLLALSPDYPPGYEKLVKYYRVTGHPEKVGALVQRLGATPAGRSMLEDLRPCLEGQAPPVTGGDGGGAGK